MHTVFNISLVDGKTRLLQSIEISLPPLERNGNMRTACHMRNTPVTGSHQLDRCIIGAASVIRYHPVGLQLIRHPVKKYDRQPLLMQPNEMIQVLRFRRQRNEQSIHRPPRQILHILHLTLIRLLALRNDHEIITIIGYRLDAAQHLGEKYIRHIAQYHPDTPAPLVLQTLRHEIRPVIMLGRIALNKHTRFGADLIAVLQRPGHRRITQIQRPGNVFDSDVLQLHACGIYMLNVHLMPTFAQKKASHRLLHIPPPFIFTTECLTR